jgi:hypothetical protein
MEQFETKTKPDADNCLEVVKAKSHADHSWMAWLFNSVVCGSFYPK